MPDRIVLFCMPFAGGSSLIYAPWSRPLAAAGIEMCALDYPGRGARAHWAFSETVSGLVDILQSEVVSASAVDTYCLFGHSLGALVTYELSGLATLDAFYTQTYPTTVSCAGPTRE